VSRAIAPVRLDDDLARCAGPRRKDPDSRCNTVVAQVDDRHISVRCKSCRADHEFVVKEGKIVPLHTY